MAALISRRIYLTCFQSCRSYLSCFQSCRSYLSCINAPNRLAEFAQIKVLARLSALLDAKCSPIPGVYFSNQIFLLFIIFTVAKVILLNSLFCELNWPLFVEILDSKHFNLASQILFPTVEILFLPLNLVSWVEILSNTATPNTRGFSKSYSNSHLSLSTNRMQLTNFLTCFATPFLCGY